MATSPNEEILRNVGLIPSSTELVGAVEDTNSDYVPLSPSKLVRSVSSPPIPLSDPSSTTHFRRRTVATRKRSFSGAVIGVWKDGKAQWEPQNLLSQPLMPEESSDAIARPKCTDSAPTTHNSTRKQRRQRPSIRLIIPNNHTARRPHTYLPFFSNTQSAIDPADISRTSVSCKETCPRLPRDLCISPPDEVPTGSQESSTISSLLPTAVTYASTGTRSSRFPISIWQPHEQLRTTHPLEQSRNTKEALGPPGSSSGSSAASASEDEDSFDLSRRTSMTSFSCKGEDQIPLAVLPKDEESDDLDRQSSSPGGHSEASPNAISAPTQPQARSKDSQRRLVSMVAMLRTPSVDGPTTGVASSQSYSLLTKNESRQQTQVELESRKASRPSTPTLSQAEHDLESQLYLLSTPGSSREQTSTPTVASANHDGDFPPPPPPKSARRYLQPRLSRLRRRSTQVRVAKAALTRRTNSLKGGAPSAKGIRNTDAGSKVSSDTVEAVIVNVLERLDSLDDLFNGALISHSFYSVFKRNELTLMQKVLRKMSAPAWEFRETCRPNYDSCSQPEPSSARPVPDYTPIIYYENYIRDTYIIGALKTIILRQCQSFLRDDTVAALTNHEPFQPNRIDNALWRIWTFCRLFGCNKGREGDLSAQTDWLRGGPLAHQEACTSRIVTQDSFYLSSVLLSASEHFAQGNKGGLSAEELYDITEMWNCLANITQGIVGLTEPARQYGVFDNTEVRGGDIDGEEYMLGEIVPTTGFLPPANDLLRGMAQLHPHAWAFSYP